MLKNIGCAVSSTNYENDIKFLDSTHNIKRFEIEIPSVTAFQAFDLKHFSEFKDAHKEYTFSIHIPYTNGIYKTGDNYNYFQIDNELDNKILNRMIREIQKLGNISHVVIHQWNHLSPRSPNVLNYLMDQVDELTVCIENYQVDKIEQMDWIKQYDNYPNLKLNVDLGHLICSPKRTNSIEDWIENFDSHIHSYHVHNNHGKLDEHNHLRDGIIDYDIYYPLIRNKILTLEPKYYTNECQDEMMKSFIDVYNRSIH